MRRVDVLTVECLWVLILAGAGQGICSLACTLPQDTKAEWDKDEEATVPTSTQSGGDG